MKRYNKTFIFLALCLSILGIHPALEAQIVDGNNLNVFLDPVSFYLYDLDGGGVTLSANTLSLDEAQLIYSIDGAKWTELSGFTFIDMEGDKQQIFFQLQLESPELPPDTGGEVTFLHYDSDASSDANAELFRGLSVIWDDLNSSTLSNFALTVSVSDGRYAPVPIPASALLLLSGIVGLIGFRKCMPK